MKRPRKDSNGEFNGMIRAALTALAIYLLLFGLVSAAVTPRRYDIRVGLPADTTIYANEDVVDTVTTSSCATPQPRGST